MQQVADEFRVPLKVVRRAVESRKVPNTPQGRMELQDRRITRITQAMDDLWRDIEAGERKHSALLLYERLDSRLDELLGPHSVTRLDEPKVALMERPNSTDRIRKVIETLVAHRPAARARSGARPRAGARACRAERSPARALRFEQYQ